MRRVVIALTFLMAAAAPATATASSAHHSRRPCVVPHVRPGSSLGQAQRLLRRHRCRPGRVVYRTDIHVHLNSVVRFRVRAGTVRRPGARIGIVLAAVPPPTTS
jgi:beta-lactam-binding protein with PASTA domain